MLTLEQFDRMRRLALNLAGIELADRHRELLARRSRRLGIGNAAGLDALLHSAELGEATAAQQLTGLVTTKFTSFFRHPQHFEIAAQHARRAAEQRGQAHLWSAGTATGEEAWSLAMVALEQFQTDAPPVRILATDVDVEVLATAQRGEYGERALQALSGARRTQFFGETANPRTWRITPAVRHLVEFRGLNLAGVIWPVEGPFDVIFCRNVLMYLGSGHRYAVLERLASLLAPEGVLLLDPTEHLGNAGHLFTPGAGGVYARRNPNGQSNRRLGGNTPAPWGAQADRHFRPTTIKL